MKYSELDFIYSILRDRVRDVQDGTIELETLPDVVYDEMETRLGSFLTSRGRSGEVPDSIIPPKILNRDRRV